MQAQPYSPLWVILVIAQKREKMSAFNPSLTRKDCACYLNPKFEPYTQVFTSDSIIKKISDKADEKVHKAGCKNQQVFNLNVLDPCIELSRNIKYPCLLRDHMKIIEYEVESEV